MNRKLLLILAILLNLYKANSQVIDTSFGTNGIVVSELSQNVDALNALALQTDGKILALGFSNGKMTILRYQTNGTLDSTFGVNGRVSSTYTCSFGSPATIKVLDDGKILVLGRNNSTMLVAKYTAEGSVDTTFGINGIANVSADVAMDSPWARAMELFPDGKIIVTGALGTNTIFMMKYDANGLPDATFGTNGRVLTQLEEIPYLYATNSAVQPDGSILVSAINSTSGYGDFCFFKYLANGTLDTGFGTGGFVTTDIGGPLVTDTPSCIEVLNDGKILVAGYSNLSFVAVRYNADGTLDTTFNTTGITTKNVGGIYRSCTDMLVEPDGKIVLAGYIGDDFGSVRFNPDGSVDASYGVNGAYKTDFENSYDYGSSIVQQPDGKLIMGGWTSYFCSNRAFALMRFSAPSLDSESFNHTTVSVYPNPADSYITVKSDTVIESIALYDVQGRLLATKSIGSTEATLDISDKQSGVYFLRINGNGSYVSVRSIVKK
ncbi:T9SS type A sorting domain-containing protein [Flavobacterium silvaticum]|uniref:T9SS type A sorting domain-containing protein n=1 Tax=Flavobacterium silvaticum TaxID=1852020 RepID=A0A972FJ21_9FLAO|nr:T9SS type A sorting domain-containing protein [Flavobacterium silvaticum]NMH26582.1 T9SS type A sorting domain-containing protein [Flavobacterium silvaticum]